MSRSVTDTERERVVSDLVAIMTPMEKAGQLAVLDAPRPDDRDGMDLLARDLREGRVGTVRGIANREQADFLQLVAQNESRLGIPLLFPTETGTGFGTIFPTAFAASSSWDMDALAAAEAVIANEGETMGFNWALSPEIALTSPDGEVLQHTCGEESLLAARIAAARVRGLQSGEAHPTLACLELTDGATDARAHLTIALAAIGGARVGSIAFDGMTGEARTRIERAFSFLKGPGGYDGIFLSEWEAIIRELTEEEIRADRRGIPVDLLSNAIESGQIGRDRIDDAVARVLRAKFRLGLLSAAHAAPFGRSASALPTPVHNREVALDLAKRCAILLRNEPELLPLGIDSGDLLLVGSAAGDRHTPLAGRAGIASSVIDGLEQLGIPHRYVPGLALRENGDSSDHMITADSMAIGMASEAAKRAGTIVMVLSVNGNGEIGEANGKLLSALFAANPNVVLLTLGARPIDPVVNGKRLPSILHAGQLGTMSGHAIAELLTGEACPSGKLSITLPGPDGGPGIPFGHGLTYADFALTNLTYELGRDRVYAYADLRNLSEREGVETVQLYLRRLAEPGEKPVAGRMPLADFQRVRLRPGEREMLTFELGRDEIGEYSEDGRFHVEPGKFELFLGLSSHRGLACEFELSAEIARAMAGTGVHPGLQNGLFGTAS